MEKIILAFIFLGGLRHSIEQWKVTFKSYMHFKNILNRGYHPGDYIICTCGKCESHSAEEIEESQKQQYELHKKEIAKNISDLLYYTVFVSGITTLSIYIFLKLTFKF